MSETNGKGFGIGETPPGSKNQGNMIDVSDIGQPMSPWGYMATVMRGMRYPAEMVQLATKQVGILERLDKEGVGDFKHTAPVIMLALGRAAIDHTDRAGMIRALIALDCKLRDWAGLEQLNYNPTQHFAIGEDPGGEPGGVLIPPADPDGDGQPAA